MFQQWETLCLRQLETKQNFAAPNGLGKLKKSTGEKQKTKGEGAPALCITLKTLY